MEQNIHVGPLTDTLPADREIEIVERKGLGHPDTICDLLAEETSIALSNYYIREFGSIMHHNVDKALLVGGEAEPSYNGGRIVKPIEIIIAGRAVMEKNGKVLPIEKIATEAVENSIRHNIGHLNVQEHIKINVKISPGSKDLIEALSAAGVEIYVCGQSAGYYGYRAEYLLSGLNMSVSAMTAHVRLQSEGYQAILF